MNKPETTPPTYFHHPRDGTAAGRVRPVMAYHDCRMIGTFRPTQQPVRGFVDRMATLEGRDGTLSVSFGHGFPWADVAEVGAKMLVLADGDMAKAKAVAERLGRELWDMREGPSRDRGRRRGAVRGCHGDQPA